MDAITILQNDHRRITKLLREFENAGELEHSERRSIVEKVSRELEIHMQAEEEVFYPAVEAVAGAKSRQRVRQAISEHEVVRATMSQLTRATPESETYAPTFELMTEKLEHHIAKEEDQMFRAGGKLGEKRLEYLGARIAGLRRMPEERPWALIAEKSVAASANGDRSSRQRKKRKSSMTLRQHRHGESIASTTSNQAALRAISKTAAAAKTVSIPRRSRGATKSRGR